MDVLKTTQEIVHEGWLIKSPPTKLWRAVCYLFITYNCELRWRKRWFALRHSGELPGQYFLEYYTDKRCRKLKGRIDLDQCEQVDAGLRFENRKQKYQYMFNVRTPKRTYYLVAENEADMNKWVDAVCQVCCLKAYTNDEEQPHEMFHFESQESPPISPASTISGPYIPISECISGRHPADNISLNLTLGQNQEHYDPSRRMAPSPPRSPTTTDAESVFTDDEWSMPVPSVNWDTFPATDESKSSHGVMDTENVLWSVRKRFGKMKIAESATTVQSEDEQPAPPRPPKPPHMLSENPGHNYLNLDGVTESSKPSTPATPAPTTPVSNVVTDETYDFPRPQTTTSASDSGSNKSKASNKHCYSNAAPSTVDDRVFRYDFHDDEPSSPRSESSITATYSNLPSPLTKDSINTNNAQITLALPPPLVHRELKPGRKTSDSLSNISNETSPGPTTNVQDASSTEHSPAEPPSINRKLKPLINKPPLEGPLQLSSPPGKNRIRAAPSPTPPANSTLPRHQSISDENIVLEDDSEEIYYYQDENNFIPASNRRVHAVVLQYLDLDLKTSENFSSTPVTTNQPSSSSTVYKTVDFLKTEAFNRTRQRVEEERKQCTDELT